VKPGDLQTSAVQVAISTRRSVQKKMGYSETGEIGRKYLHLDAAGSRVTASAYRHPFLNFRIEASIAAPQKREGEGKRLGSFRFLHAHRVRLHEIWLSEAEGALAAVASSAWRCTSTCAVIILGLTLSQQDLRRRG
jgi:DNA-nicking Smr family endonuclease